MGIFIGLLAGLVAVNFILIVVLGKSKKKTPSSNNDFEDEDNNYQIESKTVVTNKSAVNNKKAHNLEKDIELRPINKIDNEDSYNNNKSHEEKKDSVEYENMRLERAFEQSRVESKEYRTEIERPMTEETFFEPLCYGIVEFIDGEEKVKYNMSIDTVLIGRDSSKCQVVINNDKYLGRVHARLYRKIDGFYIEDLNSRNGTFLNGVRVDSQIKIVNGRFKVGRTEINVYEV